MDGPGLSLAPALLFGCLGEINKASSFAHSALHPLRRRASSCSRKDAPRFTTLLPTSSAPGALLLSSYLLVHFIIPRMRTFTMESSENAVCLHASRCARCARCADCQLDALTVVLTRTSNRVFAPLESMLRPPPLQQQHASRKSPIRNTMRELQIRGFLSNAHTMAVRIIAISIF
jgi:hypothetical protein